MQRFAMIVLLLTGCFDPHYAPCTVSCANNAECPSGLSCSNGRCRPANSTASCNAILDAQDVDASGSDAQPDAPDPACAGVVCDMAQVPSCGNNVMRTFARTGTCSDGTCSYAHTDRTCTSQGCTANVCTGGWITPTSNNPPAARYAHTAVWTGTEMIIWGGTPTSAGSRYNPSTGQWTAISTTGAPSGRRDHSAVWTGTEMIVWGGFNGLRDNPYNTGGRYNPATDTWSTLSTIGAPSARFAHTAVWTGTEMIVWGGANGTASSTAFADGARFNPTTNTWTAIPEGAATKRRDHTAVWTGTEMIVFGGSASDEGSGIAGGTFRYDPADGSWTMPTESAVISARYQHVAVWTGSEMLVWGGAQDIGSPLDTGGRLEPVASAWTALPVSPGDKREMSAVWTGDTMLLFGGNSLNEGSETNTLIGYRLFMP